MKLAIAISSLLALSAIGLLDLVSKLPVNVLLGL